MTVNAGVVNAVVIPGSAVIDTVVIGKVKPGPLGNIHVRGIKVLQSLIWRLLRGSLLHVEHGLRIVMHISILQSLNGILKL